MVYVDGRGEVGCSFFLQTVFMAQLQIDSVGVSESEKESMVSMRE